MRMRRSSPKTVSLVLPACMSAVSLLVLVTLTAACKQPAPAVVDSGPPPTPVATASAPTQLVPLDQDAAADVDANVPPVHRGGPAISVNQARAKQCCNALKAQAGTDPLLAGLVAQCNTIAMQMGPSTGGQAPEFAPLRQFLKGKNVPAMCQGL
jgi:hypothetical protein